MDPETNLLKNASGYWIKYIYSKFIFQAKHGIFNHTKCEQNIYLFWRILLQEIYMHLTNTSNFC